MNLDILNSAAGIQNTDGNPLSNSPDFSANIGAAYETDPVLAGGALTFRADLAYKSRIFGRNRTSSDYVQRLAQSSATGTRFGTWGAPRQIGIEVGLDF